VILLVVGLIAGFCLLPEGEGGDAGELDTQEASCLYFEISLVNRSNLNQGVATVTVKVEEASGVRLAEEKISDLRKAVHTGDISRSVRLIDEALRENDKNILGRNEFRVREAILK
jgi:hypothetical protein